MTDKKKDDIERVWDALAADTKRHYGSLAAFRADCAKHEQNAANGTETRPNDELDAKMGVGAHAAGAAYGTHYDARTREFSVGVKGRSR